VKRSSRGGTLAVALDIGSTAIKAVRLTAGGGLAARRAVAAPPLSRRGLRCEGDARAYCEAGEALLRKVASGLPAGTPLGIAAQRSSFLLWERRGGRPITPLISWQDRRAEDWCRRHARAGAEIGRRCGLVLSPHYAGPKLAALLERSAPLGRRLRSGDVLFGTLETFFVWRLTSGRVHATDASMAARTCLFDLRAGGWSPALLDLFGVPRAALPDIRPTSGGHEPLGGGLALAATVADQAAGALALLREGPSDAVINAGTGAFILRPARGPEERVPGFLTGPLRGLANGPDRYAHEGTINGPGPLRHRHSGSVRLPGADPAPGAYCLPDAAGLGSPHWRADLGFTLSPAAGRLDAARRRRLILEGLLFRCREILERLFPDEAPARLYLSGGLSRSASFGAGLAALLGREVESVKEAEQTLLGAARLAAGIDEALPVRTRVHSPGLPGAYLAEKYAGWQGWLRGILNAPARRRRSRQR
jgi:glycerol kinase